MHDNIVSFCSMNFEEKTFELRTRNLKTDSISKLIASEVLTFSLENILAQNILLSIEKGEIDAFIAENEEELAKRKDCCWPIYYDEKNQLEEYLRKNEYQYIKILASFGLCGWILAKEYTLVEP